MKTIRSSNSEYPVVRITRAAERSVRGEINVDLDGLNELLRSDLGLLNPTAPNYLLYGRFREPLHRGLHPAFTNTAMVQIPTNARMVYGSNRPISKRTAEVLIHESRHVADKLDKRTRYIGESVFRGAWAYGSILAGMEVAQHLPWEGLPLAAGAVYLSQLVHYSYLDGSEKRARDVHHDEALVEKYRHVIRFPNLPGA